jgi:MFS family permease
VLFTAASAACGAAPTLALLDLARALQGVGGAILMVNALPLLTHRYEGERRAMAISYWGRAATASGIAAPLIGGVLVDLLGWRAIFLVNVPVGVAVLAAAFRMLPADPPAGADRRIDVPGTALLIVALVAANFALLRGADQGWTSAATIGQSTAAAVLFAAFLRRQARAGASVLDVAMFRRQAFSGAALAVFMSRLLTIGGTVYLVLYLQQSLGLSPTGSGLLLALVLIAQMAAGLAGGKLVGRFPPGPVIAAGYAAKAVGAAGLALAFTTTDSPWPLVAPLIAWGVGVAYQSRLDTALRDGVAAPQAIASGAATVLVCSAILAAGTTAVVPALIGRHRQPS